VIEVKTLIKNKVRSSLRTEYIGLVQGIVVEENGRRKTIHEKTANQRCVASVGNQINAI
jgi:hypothetical protein